MNNIPEKPQNAFRVTLVLSSSKPRLDTVLLEELRKQKLHLALSILSRGALKELFKKKRIRIKGQPATPSSSLAQGTTYVDIHGYADKDPA
ncbi:hypothetical protein WDW37_17035 [Bdellovibrionota bacterium FG-1]